MDAQKEAALKVSQLKEAIENKLDVIVSGYALVIVNEDGQAVTFADCRTFTATRGIIDGVAQLLGTISASIEEGQEEIDDEEAR